MIAALRPILKHYQINDVTDQNILDSFHRIRRSLSPRGYVTYRKILEQVSLALADSWQIRFENREEQALAISMKEWKSFPEVSTVLRRLKQNYKLAIISNTDDDLLAASIPKLDVEFDWIVTSEGAKSYKPSQRIFEYALEKMKMPPEKIMHVGCSLFHDVAPAKSLGFTTVWANRGNARYTTDRPPEEKADFEIHNLSELVTILESA